MTESKYGYGAKTVEAKYTPQRLRTYKGNPLTLCGRIVVTPHQRHTGLDQKIMANRNLVYEAARQKHPERWTKSTRDWTLPTEVYLNPEKSDRSNVSYEAKESVS